MRLLYNAIPFVYHGRRLNSEWHHFTSTLFNVNPYLPHLFNPQLQHFRRQQNPVFSVLLKILPHRSQYKFFIVTMKQYLHFPDFQFFIKAILFAGYTGVFYPWVHTVLPMHRLVQLYEFLCVQENDWGDFVENNVRLIFYMIKEYVFFFVKYPPPPNYTLK